MDDPRRYRDRLLELETIKLWSLIVTLFGDLGRDAPVSLSGKTIRHLFGTLGIRPEAIRVALHRLKKDGWIVTRREGRESIYSLSGEGMEQTRRAYENVYRETVKYPEGWMLCLEPDGLESDAGERGDIPRLVVSRNLVWVPRRFGDRVADCVELHTNQDALPDWFVEKIVPKGLTELAQSYLEAVDGLDAVMRRCDDFDRLTLRLLALHHWRKMALRDITWFHIWLLPDGVFARAQQAIVRLLHISNSPAKQIEENKDLSLVKVAQSSAVR